MHDRPMTRRLAVALLVMALVVAACSSGTTPATVSSGSPAGTGQDLAQAWATALLVDVATGTPFRIADLSGKVVLVETMATWCPTCRAQQDDVHAALKQLPSDSVAYVVLDVDPSENADSLAAYRMSNGYTGMYAIAGDVVARALAADFGDQVLNPPSTPMIVIGTDGRVTLTDFGRKSADDIISLVQANGA